jgi:hypothetical protein
LVFKSDSVWNHIKKFSLKYDLMQFELQFGLTVILNTLLYMWLNFICNYGWAKVCQYVTGALFVIMSQTPSLKMLGLLQVASLHNNIWLNFLPLFSAILIMYKYNIARDLY